MGHWRRTWHGDEITTRAHRADGRATLGMGEGAAAEMRGVAHVLSGDLKRSIHVAVIDTFGEVEAESAELIKTGDAQWTVEVGSWLPYACVENNRGGAHRFADIGWELASHDFDAELVRAYAEEGL